MRYSRNHAKSFDAPAQFSSPFGLIHNAAKYFTKSEADADATYAGHAFRYRTHAIITRSRSETALVYKPRILGLKNEEFSFFST